MSYQIRKHLEECFKDPSQGGLRIDELRDLAKKMGIKNTGLSKAELCQAIEKKLGMPKGIKQITKVKVQKPKAEATKSTNGNLLVDKEKEEEFLSAIREGDEKLVKTLIDEGVNVNLKDNRDVTPLGFVISLFVLSGNPIYKTIIKTLLNSGANIDTPVKDGITPLMLAVTLSNEELVKLLIDEGADINIKDKDGDTPMSIAKYSGNKKIIELLRPNPLIYAIDQGNIEALKNALDSGDSPNILVKNTPLYHAIDSGKKTMVKMLLDAGAYLDFNGRKGEHALIRAIDQGNEEIVKMLLEAGIEINIPTDKNYSALSHAIIKEQKGIVKLLLDAPGIYVNGIQKEATYHETSPLYHAIDSGQTTIVKMLLDAGAKSNFNSLNRAVKNGNKEILKVLLIPLEQYQLSNFLSKAITKGQKDVVEFLLNEGTDPTYLVSDIIPPAIKKGDKDIFKLLLDYGAIRKGSGWKHNSKGETYLFSAVRQGKEDIVKVLLDTEFDPNLKNVRTGNYPLFEAIENGNEKIVRMLLQAEARVNIKNNNGETPLSIAFEKKNKNIFNLIFKKIYKKNFKKCDSNKVLGGLSMDKLRKISNEVGINAKGLKRSEICSKLGELHHLQ